MATPTPSFSGGVEDATGTPNVTPPPTDTLGTAKTPSNDGWRIVLIGIASILAAVLAFTTPRPASRKR